MKAVIMNDTAMSWKHFGCDLVMETYREQLDRVGIEITNTISPRLGIKWERKGADLCIINAEGTTHHGQGLKMITWAVENCPNVVMINGVWQDQPKGINDHLSRIKYVAMRESLSADEYPFEAEVVPDIIYTSKRLTGFKKGNPTKDLGMTDSVIRSYTGRAVDASQDPDDYLKEISQYSRICTGRHHGVVACAVLGIPFSAYPSNTHKIKGSLMDMGVPELYFDNHEDAKRNTPKDWDEKIDTYVKQAQSKIDSMFERLASF